MPGHSFGVRCEFMESFRFVYSGLFFSSILGLDDCFQLSTSVTETRLTCWFWILSSRAEVFVPGIRDDGVRGGACCEFGGL